MATVRCLLASDVPVIAAGLHVALERSAVEVIPAWDTEDVTAARFDVALLVGRRHFLTDELISRLAAQRTIVAVAVGAAVPDIVQILRAGASAALGEAATAEDVVHAVSEAESGRSLVDPAAAAALLAEWRRPVSPRPRPELTAREQDVLAGISAGLSTKAIAQQLGVSTKTVEQQRTSLYKRLGVRGAGEAVAVAMQLGLVRS